MLRPDSCLESPMGTLHETDFGNYNDQRLPTAV